MAKRKFSKTEKKKVREKDGKLGLVPYYSNSAFPEKWRRVWFLFGKAEGGCAEKKTFATCLQIGVGCKRVELFMSYLRLTHKKFDSNSNLNESSLNESSLINNRTEPEFHIT